MDNERVEGQKNARSAASGASASVMWRCLWRFRALGPLSAPGMEIGWLIAGFAVMAGFILGGEGPAAQAGQLAAISHWVGLAAWESALSSKTKPLMADWVAYGIVAGLLIARARWVVLGMTRDARPLAAAQIQADPTLFWLGAAAAPAFSSNVAGIKRVMRWMREFSASSRTLPSQALAGAAGLLAMIVLALDCAAVVAGMVFIPLWALIGSLMGAEVSWHSWMMAIGAALVLTRQGALSSASQGLKACAPALARALGGLVKGARPSAALAGARRAKASLSRALLESAAQDGTLSQLERDRLEEATRGSTAGAASKGPAKRL